MEQQKSKKQRVLDILLDLQPHHASEFIPISHHFPDLMLRLREDGYKIKTLPLDGYNKAAWYQLIAMPAAV